MEVVGPNKTSGVAIMEVSVSNKQMEHQVSTTYEGGWLKQNKWGLAIVHHHIGPTSPVLGLLVVETLNRGCIEFKYYADAIYSGLTPPG